MPSRANPGSPAGSRRIKGQIEAVERGLESELGCADVLMLVASVRGAADLIDVVRTCSHVIR
jgi:DNA-binding FrmR family transcriptional regulator